MDEILSHDFGHIRVDLGNNDSDADLEEEENRKREIHGLLADQFDEISSIGEDDDDSDDPESMSIERGNEDGMTSTPLIKSPPRVRKNNSNFNAIPEESYHESFDADGSVEGARRATDETGDGFHVQYLLDQNNHLSAESTKLKHHLSVVSGDYEGLQFKFQRIEEENQKKDQELLHLNGKVAALEMQVKTEVDAKKEFSRKFALAESTIQSLQNQMSDLSRSDCLVRLQDHHDTLVKRMKDDHENELFGLRENIEELEINLEDKQSVIKELENELEVQKNQISNFKRKSPSSSKIPKSVSSPKSDSQNTALFESLQCIKKELELAMKGNQDLKNQVQSMQTSLNEYKNQNCDLNTILREKDCLIDRLRGELRKIKTGNREINEKLQNVTQKLKANEELAESKATQIAQLENLLKSSKDDIQRLEEKLRKSDRRKSSSPNAEQLFTSAEVKKMVKEATEDWARCTEDNYHQLYAKQIKKMEVSYENSRQDVLRQANSSLMKQFQDDVDTLCSWIKDLAARCDKPMNEHVEQVLSPVRDLWHAIDAAFEESKEKLIQKREEVEEARRELKQAYVSTIEEPKDDNSSLTAQVNELKKELEQLGHKLLKYKKMSKRLQEDNGHEKEKLKAEFTLLLEAKTKHFKEREKKLKAQLDSQWDDMCHQINRAFVDGLKQVKSQADDVLEECQRKSMDHFMVGIQKYHEIVTEKLNTQTSSSLTDIAHPDDRLVSQNICVF